MADYERKVSSTYIGDYTQEVPRVDYFKFIEFDANKKLQFITFNNSGIPRAIYTTSLHHNNSLVTNLQFNNSQKNYLCIQANNSDINISVNDNNIIEFNGLTEIKNDISYTAHFNMKNICFKVKINA